MNFRQLETFYWISKLGTFAAAAEKLNATQSTVSARISELERSLGAELFDRSGRTARLTPQGRALQDHAESALKLWGAIYADISRSETLSGRVRIGVGEIVALTWLPALQRDLGRRCPGVEVELLVDVTVSIHELMQQGRLDVVFGVAPHASPNLVSTSLGRVEMRWAAAPALGLAGRSLLAGEIAAQPIFSLSKGSHLHAHFLAWAAEHDIRKPMIHPCNSITTMIALTRGGTGVAVLPVPLIEEEIEAGRLDIVDAPLPVDHYDFYVTRERNTLDRAVLATVEAALEVNTFSAPREDGGTQEGARGPATA